MPLLGKRERKRQFIRMTPSGNLLVRVAERGTLELFSDVECPLCGVRLDEHGEDECRYFECMTLDQLVLFDCARYVPQE